MSQEDVQKFVSEIDSYGNEEDEDEEEKTHEKYEETGRESVEE